MKTVAYLLDIFPAVSETFVVQEILELRRLGYDLRICALQEGEGASVHPDVAALARGAWYLRPHTSLRHRFSGLVYWWMTDRTRFMQTYRFARRQRSRAVWRHFTRSLHLAMVIRRSGVQHLHAHFAATACEYAMLTGMLTGARFTFTAHAYDIFKSPTLLAEKVRAAAAVVTISRYNKDAILERTDAGVHDKIAVIPCGIELAYFSPNGTSGRSHEATRPLHLVSVGRLVSKKGFAYLIDALRRLHRDGVPVRCSIIGEGPQRDELAERIWFHGLQEQVTLLGAQGREAVRALLDEADLFVLPCVVTEDGDRDGIPVSLKEAMAMGLPVVSTTLAGIEEAVQEGTGLLVPPQDAAALALAIRRLVAAGPEGRAEMGRRCREAAQREFDCRVQGRALANLFEGC